MKVSFLNWWVVSIALAVLAAVLLTWPLPLLILGLRPWWVRALMAAAVVAIWAVCAAVRSWRRRAAAKALEDAVTAGPADDEAKLLGRRLTEALAQLKAAQGKGRSDYLYSRPWYVIIGPPGAGKTTALLNSGLHFPGSSVALKGVGGTRNVDFWFADEAVLVDTAGRYLTQDSDAAVDSRGWDGFLTALRQRRPLRPINGVIIAIGMDALLKGDRSAIDVNAAAVRRRLIELGKKLELAAPVYVLFTKLDLVAGFTEFFADLDAEARRSVLGVTLPLGKIDASGMSAALDRVVQDLSDRVATRLQDEGDPLRRALILGFPEQLLALRPRLLRFLDGAFPDVEGQASLRGLYFTSGVQDGAPFDRLLSGVAKVFVRPQVTQGVGGRTYFLNRLLHEVIFAEQGLVSDDPRAKARRQIQLAIGLGAVALTTTIVLALWTFNLFGALQFQKQLRVSAVNAAEGAKSAGINLEEVSANDPPMDQALPFLDSLRNLPGGYADQMAGRQPLFGGFGLYPKALAESARQTYLKGLARVVLPRTLLHLESVLQQSSGDPLATYNALRTYRMLGGDHEIDRGSARDWIVSDWENSSLAGGDLSDDRKRLGAHLDAMLGDPELNSVWPNRRADLDDQLIQSAQRTAQRLSLPERAYAILREKASGQGPPWTVGSVIGSGDTAAFAGGDAVRDLKVPYFYTRDGYSKIYIPGLPEVQADLKRELWVLGSDADTQSLQTQFSSIREGVAAAYARDYIAAWSNLLSQLQPGDLAHNADARTTFTKQPSPLKVLLLSVIENTSLSNSSGAKAEKAVLGQLAKAPGLSVLTGGGQGGIDVARQVDGAFKSLRDFVGDGKSSSAPIDSFINAIRDARKASLVASAGSLGDQSQINQAEGDIKFSAESAPPMIKAFVDKAAQGGVAAGQAIKEGALADAYKTLADSCLKATSDRYPFSRVAKYEATVADMNRLFGAGGEMDSFIKTRLSPLLDITGAKWRWKADNENARGLDPVSAERFQKASEVMDVVSSGLPFSVELASFGGPVTAVDFTSGGVTNHFEGTSLSPRQYQWALSLQTSDTTVVLYANGKEVKRYQGQGPWGLYRLMDQAKISPSGASAVSATFGEGASTVTLKISYPPPHNPFSWAGAWSFKCPPTL